MKGRCGCKRLCKFSFGLALGVTMALAVLIHALWAIQYGPTPMMTAMNIPVPTFNQALMHALWTLIEGFIFGFFMALFYNLISCGCPCCKRPSCGCCNCDAANQKLDQK